jgi:hypothetical protein
MPGPVKRFVQAFVHLEKSQVVFCFSLANLLSVPLWLYLFTRADPQMDYFREAPADVSLYLYGALLAIAGAVGLTVLFVAVAAMAHVWDFPLTRRVLGVAVCGLLSIGAAAVSVKMEWSRSAMYSAIGVFAVAALLVAFGGGAGRVLARTGVAAIAMLWPLALITPAALFWQVRSSPPASAFARKASAPFLAVRPGAPRVVWIIFDELDQELLFPLRPKRIALPEFDRLRSISLHAEQAKATAFFTSEAFPSLITGRIVRDVLPTDPKTLRLAFRDGSKEQWGQTAGVFKSAREAGFNVGLTGWHHPFCRVFGDVLSTCKWEMNHDAFSTLRREYVYRDMPQGLYRFAGNLYGRIRGGGAVQSAEYREIAAEQRAQVDRLIESALEMIGDERYGLLLLHFPVPHPPSIARVADGNYFDNLTEADAILGRLRRKLESSAMWDKSTFLVMSDHPLRVPIWEFRPTWTEEEARIAKERVKLSVPFLLKMPGQSAPVAYEEKFNTVITHDLILEILHGRLRDALSVSEWLRSRTKGDAQQTGSVKMPGDEG